MYVLIWAIFDGYVFTCLVSVHFIHNMFLFYGGCLGREMFNVFGYMLYIPKLNVTLQEGEQLPCLKTNFYIQFYRECDIKQMLTRMVIIRNIELLIYAIFITFYNVYFFDSNISDDIDNIFAKNNTNYSYQNVILRLMLILGVVTIFVAPLFWVWVLHSGIIDFTVKKEEITFKSIFEAIELDRFAVIKKDFSTLEDLTKPDADGNTPLHRACRLRKYRILNWILNDSSFGNELDVNSINNKHETPLFCACKSGAIDCVKCIFQSQPNLNVAISNKHNESILFEACKRGHDNIVQYLLDSDRVPNQMINQTTTPLNMTALHIVALKGYKKCLDLLLACPEIDINVLNTDNEAPIHLAVTNRNQSASLAIFNDARFTLSSINFDKLWYYAIKYDIAAIMSKLLEAAEHSGRFSLLAPCVIQFGGSDEVKSIENECDDTPLLIASRHDAGSIIELIGSKDVSSMNEVDSSGFSPLFLACWNGCKNAALALIELDKKVSDEENEDILLFKTKHDKTSVAMAACKGGLKEILIVLAKAINKRYGKARLQRELMKYNNEYNHTWIPNTQQFRVNHICMQI